MDDHNMQSEIRNQVKLHVSSVSGDLSMTLRFIKSIYYSQPSLYL